MRATRQRTVPALSLGLKLGEKKHSSTNRHGASSTEEEYLTLDDIRAFLEHGEERLVDFKRQQYPIIGAGNNDKNNAKFIKDILSLANTPREKTAYILIGVDEKKHSIPGIPRKHVIDDAKLQQKVNSKTNHPIEFFTYSIRVNRTRVVQTIAFPPLGERFPIYLLESLPSIKAETVYYRQGTSNKEATIDELARLAKEWVQLDDKPNISFEIDSPNLLPDGRLLTVELTPVHLDEASNLDESARERVAGATTGFTLVKVFLNLMNHSPRYKADAKVRLSLTRTSPWTGLPVDVDKAMTGKWWVIWHSPKWEDEASLTIYPGETQRHICPLVFDTMGPGKVFLHLFISCDIIGVLVDKEFELDVIRKPFECDFQKRQQFLLPYNEQTLFDQIKQLARARECKAKNREAVPRSGK